MTYNFKKNKKALWILVFAVVGAITFFLVSSGELQLGDDMWFKHQIETRNLFEFLSHRYYNWTGRLPAETLLTSMIQLPLIYWHLLITISVLLMGWSVSEIYRHYLGNEKNIYLKIVTFLLSVSIPFLVWAYSDSWCLNPPYKRELSCSVTGSGIYWYTGFFNYFLPISLVFAMIFLFLKMQKSEKKLNYSILIVVFGIYALCIEQVVVFWALFCIMNFVTYFRERWNENKAEIIKNFFKTAEAWIYIITALISLFFITAPGNKNRFSIEIGEWFPEFSKLSLLQKLQLGIGASFEHFALHMEWLILTIFILSLVVAFILKNKLAVLFSGFGLLASAYLIYKTRVQTDKPFKIITVIIDNGISLHWSKKNALVIFIIMLCLFLITFLVFEKKARKFLLFTLTTAVISGIVIGFSPTVYGSGIRTQYLSYILYTFVLIAYVYRLLQMLLGGKDFKWKKFH